MSNIAIRTFVTGDVESLINKLTESLKAIGFGILTRIDFDQKIKEKLNQDMPRTVVLGACNPKLAFQAYQQTKDVALLIPCNIVVRQAGASRVAIEATRPSAMFGFLPDLKDKGDVMLIEQQLESVIANL